MDYVIAKNRYNTHGDTIVPFAATHAIELRSKEQRNIIKIKNTIVLMHTCSKQHLTYLFKLWRCRGREVVSAEAARMYFVSEYQSLQFKVHIYLYIQIFQNSTNNKCIFLWYSIVQS